MKRIAYLLVALTTLGACDPLTENPESFLTQDNFFQTAQDAVAAVNAAYRPLNQTNSYGLLLITVQDLASDDFYGNVAEPTAAVHELDEFRPNATNAQLLNIWTNAYLSISRANTVLEKAPTIQTSNKALVNRAMAEAKFIRALSLFNLARFFGDVPMPLTGTNSTEGLAIARTPVAEVYAQIIKDFTEAADVLPATYTGADLGRPTAWAAKGLLAKTYLYRKQWDKTAALCESIMTSGKYSLWPNFEDAFKPSNKNGPESLFEIQFKGPGLGQGNSLLQYNLPRNGVLGSGYGVCYPTPDLLASFETGDARYAATFFNSFTRNGTRVTFSPVHVRKFIDENAINGGYTNDSDLNFPVLRYAEVLLLYAEALNEVSPADAKAVAALNQVRKRAKLADTPAKTQAALRTAIWQERRSELVNESNRYSDLVRTGRLVERVKAAKTTGVPNAAKPTETNNLMPIPQRELDANPNLTQNPGY